MRFVYSRAFIPEITLNENRVCYFGLTKTWIY